MVVIFNTTDEALFDKGEVSLESATKMVSLAPSYNGKQMGTLLSSCTAFLLSVCLCRCKSFWKV